MSELKQQIQEEVKAAMKARDQKALTTLRGLSAAVKQVEVDSRVEVTDDQVLGIIQKEIKKRRDAIGFAEQQNRTEMVAENEQEIEVLQRFLGKQLSEAELRELITQLIHEGADSIGKVMGELNKRHKGQFEGKIASQLANSMLGAQ
ncbi:MAG: GatB/YqeY domain-containing protein [Bdellovibrionales bacterium]|nr:GatB/YqeY domain-containing protein [Bdellovibrionales bacterium]